MANILVVDDSPEIISWLSYELDQAGHSVTTAMNGEEGLVMLECARPDLAIVDIDMPVMNGFQMLKRLRGMKKLTDLHVMMLTGRGREADWVQGYKLGVHDYLTKPLEITELLDSIENILRLSPEQILERCAQELDKSEMLLKLENMFAETSPGLPDSFLEEPELATDEPVVVEADPVKRGFFARMFRRSATSTPSLSH
ncbi:MAG TPA: response regulator [Actinomycetota bacterium]|nr:response regulator [Actinomycetota bacterium]